MPLFLKISNLLNEENDFDSSVELWLLVALYHDIGYFSEYLHQGNVIYNKIFKHDPLSDVYEGMLDCLSKFEEQRNDVLAYSYNEILMYDDAARDFHINDDERIDHGILGGYISFNKMLRKTKGEKKNQSDIFKAKMCALTIAQHNMFKSYSEEDDTCFPGKPTKLTAASDFRISSKTPLLLFLSLIDTIECVKRLSKTNNDNAYLETLTVLRSIRINKYDDWIVIDYSELEKQVLKKKNEKLHLSFVKYLESIKSLHMWTSLRVKDDKNCVVKIKCA